MCITCVAYDRTHIRPRFARCKTCRAPCRPYPRNTTRVTRVCRVVHGLRDGTRTCSTGIASFDPCGRDDRNGAAQTRTIPHLNSAPNFAILPFKNSVTYTAVPCSNAHTAELLIFYSRVRTCSRYGRGCFNGVRWAKREGSQVKAGGERVPRPDILKLRY